MLWIRDILIWIRIRGSVPLNNESRSESCKFIAHLVRSQVTELREGSLFTFEDEAGKKFSTKKKFLPVSELDPHPGFGSGFKSEIRLRMRIRIRKLTSGRSGFETGSETFLSDPQHW